jgi:hypothetical protein
MDSDPPPDGNNRNQYLLLRNVAIIGFLIHFTKQIDTTKRSPFPDKKLRSLYMEAQEPFV